MYRISKRNANKGNPFITFASEKKAEWESEGRKFPQGIKDVVPLAGEIWKKMTEEERQPYKEKAKGWNGNKLGTKVHKMQTAKLADVYPLALAGPSTVKFADHHYQTWPEIATGNDEKRSKGTSGTIRELLALNSQDQTTAVFVIISFSYFNTADGSHLPSEIGLVAFSLKEGVLGNYGTLINPGDVLLRNRVNKFNDHHGMPEFRKWSTESCDSNTVMKHVKKLLRNCKAVADDGKYFLFCKKREIQSAYDCLDWLRNAAGWTSDDLKYELFSLDELFFQLVKVGTANFLRSKRQEEDKLAQCSQIDRKIGYGLPHCSLQFDNIFVQDEKSRKSDEDEIDGGATGTAFANEEEAGSYLQSQDFVHIPELSCTYHAKNEAGTRICPLRRVNRYAFILLDFMIGCGYWEIEPKEGRHYVHKNLQIKKTLQNLKI